jgi:hypothetical protein
MSTVTKIDSPAVREHSRSLLAAMIVELRAQRRTLTDEINDMVSVMRNDLAGKTWSDGTYTVSYLPGYFVGVPSRRIGNAIAFKRARLEPYVQIKRKAAK